MEKSVIVGTAGHIDHGKSALVRALTGKDPDRLPEEKRRGITIDIGFADLNLGDVTVSFVDAPGHERFVKNMLAGAHGIDLLALVIAADEGVMPQTREHFDICRLLDVKKGLIVITKADLVDEELIQVVKAEAEELVAGSFLDGAPILPVSSKTGAGLTDLNETLLQQASELPPRSLDLVPRLPIDRAFSMKGFGTVITGTLVSGEIAEGDELELLPPAVRVRARGLQVHGAVVKRARRGQRTAINLGGVDVSAIQRGMVLAPVGRLQPTSIFDVKLDVLRSAPRPVRSRVRVRLHIQAAEVLGRLRVLEQSGEIEPGQTGFAQIRLESPVMCVAGERFIIRSYSPSQTIAGGEVLDPLAIKHRGKDMAVVRRRLTALVDADQLTRFGIFVESAGDRGQRLSDIAARTCWTDEVLTRTAAQAKDSKTIIDCEGVFISQNSFDRLGRRAVKEVRAHHKREPLARGIARETLRERQFAHTRPEVFRAVLIQLEQDGTLVSDRDIVRAHEHSREVSSADADLRDRLAAIYEKAALQPPPLDEALRSAGFAGSQIAHGRRILQLLLDAHILVRVQGEMFFHGAALEDLIAKLRAWSRQSGTPRPIDIAAFKSLAGVSRKYAIPLLEYMDRERITQRAGDSRIIRE